MKMDYATLMKNFIRIDDAAIRYMTELSKELTGPDGSTGCALFIYRCALEEVRRRAIKDDSPPPYIITEDIVRSLGLTRKDFEQDSDDFKTLKMPSPQ